MSDQPEALRLAAELEAARDDPMWADHAEITKEACARSAAELRRLSIENDALGLHLSERMKDLAAVEAQRDALLEALKMARPHIATHSMDGYHAEARADAAIKAVEEKA